MSRPEGKDGSEICFASGHVPGVEYGLGPEGDIEDSSSGWAILGGTSDSSTGTGIPCLCCGFRGRSRAVKATHPLVKDVPITG